MPLDGLHDMGNQIAYLLSLCKYVESYLSDLQRSGDEKLVSTPYQNGLLFAATNRNSRLVQDNLEEASRTIRSWTDEVRKIMNEHA